MLRYQALATAAVLLPATVTLGDDITYISSTGGAFSWATSWDAGAPPVAGDNAIFDHLGVRPVWLPWHYETDRLIVENGTLTLQLMGYEFDALNTGSGAYTNMAVQVGMNSGDLGILDIEGPGTLNARALACGMFGGAGAWTNVTEGATLDLEEAYAGTAGAWGAIAVTDASTLDTLQLWLGLNGLGSLGVHGGSTVNAPTCLVGHSDDGTIDITNGTLNTATTYVGNLPAGDGTVTIEGGDAAWINTGTLWVGDEGTGRLDISDNGFAHVVQWLNIGASGSSDGTVELGASGFATLWVDESMSVGGSQIGDGGDGLVVIHDGAVVDVIGNTDIYAMGIIDFEGGNLRTDDVRTPTGGGLFSWRGGTLALRGDQVDVDANSALAPLYAILPDMTLEVFNTIDVGQPGVGSSLQVQGGTFTAETATMGATPGERGSTWISDGLMDVDMLASGGSMTADGGAGTVSAIDTGRVEVAAKAIAWPDGLIGVGFDATFIMRELEVPGGFVQASGNGAMIITSDLTTASPGLLIDGLDETRMTIGPGGEFLSVNPASIATVGGGRGVLSIDDGLFGSPAIAVGSAFGSAVEARVEFNSGTIETEGMIVRDDGHLALAMGTIELDGGALDMHGRLDPGGTVDGDVTLHPTAATHVELRGASMTETNSMSVEGALTLDGTIHVDVTDPSLAVAQGDSIAILDSTTLSGSFAGVVVTGDLGALRPSVRQVGSTIEIVITNRSDINGDGIVDVADLLAVIAAWGACDEPCDADVNGDGIVDVTDMLTVIADWT